MEGVSVIWARAPSLDKLRRELDRQLSGYSADDVVAVSHAAEPVGVKHSGGIWSGGRATTQLEYSAVVLVRA
jgi:hypothetical protein